MDIFFSSFLDVRALAYLFSFFWIPIWLLHREKAESYLMWMEYLLLDLWLLISFFVVSFISWSLFDFFNFFLCMQNMVWLPFLFANQFLHITMLTSLSSYLVSLFDVAIFKPKLYWYFIKSHKLLAQRLIDMALHTCLMTEIWLWIV